MENVQFTPEGLLLQFPLNGAWRTAMKWGAIHLNAWREQTAVRFSAWSLCA